MDTLRIEKTFLCAKYPHPARWFPHPTPMLYDLFFPQKTRLFPKNDHVIHKRPVFAHKKCFLLWNFSQKMLAKKPGVSPAWLVFCRDTENVLSYRPLSA